MKQLTLRGERIEMIVYLIATVLLTSLLVMREVRGRRVQSAAVAPGDAVASVAGVSSSRVTLTVFSDYQCRSCRMLDSLLAALYEQGHPQVTVNYRHFPTPNHSRAFEAALAAECARAHGRFLPFHRAVFALQDSLETIAWTTVASDIGINNMPDFRRCVTAQRFRYKVEQHLAEGRDKHVDRVPSVLIDEQLVTGNLLNAALLDSIVNARLASSRTGAELR